MIPVTTFAGRTVAVFGLGKSGLDTCRALLEGGARVIAFDDAAAKVSEAASADIPTQDLHAINWREIAALVLTPGVPLTHPKPHWSAALAKEAGVPVIGDIELFERERAHHRPDTPLVAITGTNGKSTTTALTAHLLKTRGRDTQMGGNIGVPILALEPFIDQPRSYVIECSSYQIDLAPSLKPTVGILLNLSPDHIDRHGTMENYAAVKERLVAAAQTAVIGVDDKHCRAIADRVERAGTKVIRISVVGPVRDGFYAEGSRIVRAAGGKSHAFAQLTGIGSLRGAHNAQNACAAAAAALTLGVDVPTIQEGLRTFPGLAHRMEEVGRKGGVLYVNDSKATNADSAAKALASFDNIFWIAGGKPKEGGIEELAPFFPKIRKAYLIGEAAADFSLTLGDKADSEIVITLDRAVVAAARDAQATGGKDAVVLLSPACASFDQYPNFEVRGDKFRTLVQTLPD